MLLGIFVRAATRLWMEQSSQSGHFSDDLYLGHLGLQRYCYSFQAVLQ